MILLDNICIGNKIQRVVDKKVTEVICIMIGYSDESFITKEFGNITSKDFSMYEPILLTDKIIREARFDLISNSKQSIAHYSHHDMAFEFEFEDDKAVMLVNGAFFKEFCFVHELQNLFYIATGEKLLFHHHAWIDESAF